MVLSSLKKNSESAVSWPAFRLALPPAKLCSSHSSESRVVGTASIAAMVLMPPT